MERKRILILSLAYLPVPQAGFPFVGGAEVAVKEITDRLPEFEFEIISADIRNFWSKYFYPFWAYRRAVRQHREKKYDLIWAIMANQAGIAAALFKRHFSSVPFLLTLQEGDDLSSLAYRFRLLAPRLFAVFHRADQITAISNYLGTWARQMGAQCPIEIVPNGVDLDKFKTKNEKRKVTTQNSKVIIHTGRLVKKNGVDILIESLQFLDLEIKLQILGSGIEEMSLRQFMSRLSLDNRVQFLGHVPPNEVLEYLTQADVFVRPSRSEGLGNSFLEAMAAGVPVVGTSVGGIPDFLKDGETGWFCEGDNPGSIADKVKYILNPENRDEISRVVINAKKLVHEKYDWNIIAQKMAQVMVNLLTVDK